MVNKTLKRVVTFGLTVALALTAVGCGSTDSAEEETTTAEAVAEVTEASEEKEEEPVTEVAENDQLASTEGDASESDAPIEFVYTGDPVTIKVGANITPHSEILEQAKPILAEQGITLEIVQIEDSITPNTGVIEGSLDANYFQHVPYLEQFNEENGSDLVSIGAVHYEPFGIYAGKTTDLKDLPDGATVAVPNNIEFKELAPEQLVQALPDVDIAVINGNYAIEGGLGVKDALAVEANDGLAAKTYGNIVATSADKENDEALKALVSVLQSKAIADYINETYDGAVVPLY